jgi:indoleamine 2,3-dioxygenase
MDALLGVGHASDPLRTFLDELHIYRPPGHRRFIDDVRAENGVRDFVRRTGRRGLTEADNAAVQAVADFRSRHLEYAASYINSQGRKSAGNDTEIGTGGTPFMKYLKKHREETKANLLSVG